MRWPSSEPQSRFGLRRQPREPLRSARGTGHRGHRWSKRCRGSAKKAGRISVGPIPGDIVFVGVIDIARYRAGYKAGTMARSLRRVPIPEEASRCRKEIPFVASAEMILQSSDRWMGRRMRRSGNDAKGCPRATERVARGHRCTERQYEDRIRFIHHGTPTGFATSEPILGRLSPPPTL